jgi:hypothetical protein
MQQHFSGIDAHMTAKMLAAVQAMETFKKGFLEAMRVALPPLLAAGQAIYDAHYRVYINAGAIYGESHEGFLRWAEEQARIARLRREAEEIEARQELMAMARRQLRRRAG